MTSQTAPTQRLEGVVRKKAVLFVRVRTVPHKPTLTQAISAAQQDFCEELAQILEAEAVRIFTVVGGTTEPTVQEAIEQALQLVEAENIDYFIVSGPDRLTRRWDEFIRINNRLEAIGARLIADQGMAHLQKSAPPIPNNREGNQS